ncbi:hypothetical protein MTR62_20300 [Novosphingobium sp. 1949]|uniref:Uncharacterized protein n=1 Tax=Novosphingobium organovorum TaxID=2930092 RepID=A0ABT0BIW9_9SPHN|nr:hypothetical protein [Novosphingobium organovorum]MCJ2185008.1 hypothetical protein [Novosphingobium organovorum]
MNLIEHAFFALLAQLAIGLASRNWWAAGAIPSAYFLGRELTQAEYRWIEHFGHGLRANMPWWGAFDPRVWTTADQFADWIGPLFATTLVALAVHGHRRSGTRA